MSNSSNNTVLAMYCTRNTQEVADEEANALSKYNNMYITAIPLADKNAYKITNVFDPHIRMNNQLGFHTKHLPRIDNFSKNDGRNESPKQRVQHLLVWALRVASNNMPSISGSDSQELVILAEENYDFSCYLRLSRVSNLDVEIKKLKGEQEKIIRDILDDMKNETAEKRHDKNG